MAENEQYTTDELCRVIASTTAQATGQAKAIIKAMDKLNDELNRIADTAADCVKRFVLALLENATDEDMQQLTEYQDIPAELRGIIIAHYIRDHGGVELSVTDGNRADLQAIENGIEQCLDENERLCRYDVQETR